MVVPAARVEGRDRQVCERGPPAPCQREMETAGMRVRGEEYRVFLELECAGLLSGVGKAPLDPKRRVGGG